MSKFWKREEGIERELRNAFSAPDGFAEGLSERVRQSAPLPRFARASHRLLLTSLTVFMLGTFASFGGVGLAAGGVQQTVSAVAHVTVSQKPVVHRTTAATDEYGKAVTKPKVVVKHHTVKQKPKVTVLAAVTKKQSTLPFTGISLLATALLSLVFLASGLILRRIGSRAPRSF